MTLETTSSGGGGGAVTNAGTFAVQESGAALTSLQLIDDAVKTDDAAFTPATDKILMIGAEADMTSPDLVDEGDAGALRMSLRRELLVQVRDAAGNERGLNVDASGQVAVTVASIAAGTNNIGDVDVLSIAAGDNNIGNVDIVTVPADPFGANADAAATAGSTGSVQAKLRLMTSQLDSIKTAVELIDNAVSGTTLTVSAVPSTTGGLSIFKSLDLDETEEEVKATAGQVYSVWFTNTATTTRFLKFYNDTAANVIVGTTVPVITIGLPGNASDDISGSFNIGGNGLAFSTAITVAVTTVAADNDATAPGTGDVLVMIGFK